MWSISCKNFTISCTKVKTNYIWFIINEENKHCAIVDPGNATATLKFITEKNLIPDAILITHHHSDHTGGIKELISHYPIPVYGPKHETIPGLDHPLEENDIVALNNIGINFTAIDLPGHTKGHIAYYGDGVLFCGDVLFAAGCGRIFEGTAEEMLTSLNKLTQLPDDTLVFCAHEYTLHNLRFALSIEPQNHIIQKRINECENLQKQNLPTLPSTIDLEKATNPFLRCTESTVIDAAYHHSGQQPANALETFKIIRKWKNEL
jgi:hydroxyacylglutathione hydrolase